MQFQLKFQQVFLVTFDKLIPILCEDAKGKEQPRCATRRRGKRMGGWEEEEKNQKETNGGLVLPNIKICHEAIIFKTVWIGTWVNK